MKVHLISIGGAVMHNFALALQAQGHQVTGSDDAIFEPSRSRLKNAGLLPTEMRWNEKNITEDLDLVLLGMHAKKENPELILMGDKIIGPSKSKLKIPPKDYIMPKPKPKNED